MKKRDELLIANEELAYQNEEKEKRAAELVIANKELAFQNEEKENRAAELIIANMELVFQNEEKKLRAAELVIANNGLRNAESQIAELNSSLEKRIVERTAQLEAANKDMESFSYSVSHDLRAPLRAINGFTQILVEDYENELKPDAQDLLKEIVRSSNRMSKLIDNLLEFSRIGSQNFSLAKVRVREMVDSIISDLKSQYKNQKVLVIINHLEDVKADKNMLKQVFINLLSNAFKYSGKCKDPQIEIGSYQQNGHLVYFVRDNGAGFDMAYYDKLFGVFQRLHGANEFEGTGVGLAIIQRIVTKHNGKVWAEGKVNQGASFYISLPNDI